MIGDGGSPGYRDLYYSWERRQWEAGAIDFSEDRRQWRDDFTPEMRRSLLWALSSLSVGEEQGTELLVPFVDAAPSEEQQVFLTTQLADRARHAVFFDRFYSEALDERSDTMDMRLAGRAARHDGRRSLLVEVLAEASRKIAREPHNFNALVEGVVLYHIVIEGGLALTAQRLLLDHAGRQGFLPGLRHGLTAVVQDQERHVTFAVRFLKETVDADARYADVIEELVERITPIALSVIEAPNGDASCFDALSYGPGELATAARIAVSERLRVVGVDSAA